MASTTEESPRRNDPPPAYDDASSQPSRLPIRPQPQLQVATLPAPQILTPPAVRPQSGDCDGPTDFFVLVLLTNLVCFFFNILTLFTGSIALVMAIRAQHEKRIYHYTSAQRCAAIAVVLSFCNVVWTGVIVSIAVGASVGGVCQHYKDYYPIGTGKYSVCAGA